MDGKQELARRSARLPKDRHARDEARWFLHAQGQTLGPFSDRIVLGALQVGDILPSDRIYAAGDPGWTPVEEHPYFASFSVVVDRARVSDLTELPSPRFLLRRRAPAPIPPEPVSSLPTPALEIAPTVAPTVAPAALVPEPTLPAPIAVEPPRVMVVEALPVAAPEHAPEPLVEAATEPTPEPLPAVEPAAETEPDPGLESLALELVRAVELEEEAAAPQATTPAPAPLVAPLLAEIPPRPDFQAVFLADPARERPSTRKSGPRVIQLELKLPERPLRAALALALVIGIAVAAGYGWSENKTRGQNGFRPSDPSSPTALPQETGDPIPPLKAPTRPQRE